MAYRVELHSSLSIDDFRNIGLQDTSLTRASVKTVRHPFDYTFTLTRTRGLPTLYARFEPCNIDSLKYLELDEAEEDIQRAATLVRSITGGIFQVQPDARIVKSSGGEKSYPCYEGDEFHAGEFIIELAPEDEGISIDRTASKVVPTTKKYAGSNRYYRELAEINRSVDAWDHAFLRFNNSPSQQHNNGSDPRITEPYAMDFTCRNIADFAKILSEEGNGFSVNDLIEHSLNLVIIVPCPNPPGREAVVQ